MKRKRNDAKRIDDALDRLLLATWSDVAPVVVMLAPSVVYARAWVDGFRFGQDRLAIGAVIGSVDLSSARLVTLREALCDPAANSIPDVKRLASLLD